MTHIRQYYYTITVFQIKVILKYIYYATFILLSLPTIELFYFVATSFHFTDLTRLKMLQRNVNQH